MVMYQSMLYVALCGMFVGFAICRVSNVSIVSDMLTRVGGKDVQY